MNISSLPTAMQDLDLLKDAILHNRRDLCEKIAQMYRPLMPDSPIISTINFFHNQDRFSDLLLPDDIPEKRIPVKVKSDGNCMFNSASVLMTGYERLSTPLRLLTAAELFLHADFYAYHPRYCNTDMAFCQKSQFVVSLSHDKSDATDRVDAIKKEALVTCTPKKWAGLVQLHALASVIGLKIYSIYPNVCHGIRPLFHGCICPREFKAHIEHEGTVLTNI